MDIRDDAQTPWLMQFSAHDVAAMDLTAFRPLVGKQWYSDACFTRNGERVRISYIKALPDMKVGVVHRYVDYDFQLIVDVNENLEQLQGNGIIE